MKEYMLRRVIFSLNEDWKKEEQDFRERLTREGILCIDFVKTEWSRIKKNKDTVVLTDSPETGAKLAREGIAYFGCCHTMDVRLNQKSAMEATDADTAGIWFDGAALVLENFEEIDAKYLEEWMLRAKGMPATITRTGRLLIREIADEDISELERIGRECGEAENSRFTKEYLYSYRRTAYRLQGFGLWSVLYQDRVIGCCGFEPWGERLETDMLSDRNDQPLVCRDNIIPYHFSFREASAASSGNILEMQYMLASACHRQGFGTEMCRAALVYARERLDTDEVRLRIREENLSSRALAEKLGFAPTTGFGGA